MDKNKPVIAKTSPLQMFLLFLGVIAMLYGATYQQYKHFNMNDPKGLDDARSYASMFRGNYDVASIHRNRFVIPYLASLVGKGMERFNLDKEEICKLSFYAVNGLLTVMAALLFFRILFLFGFDWRLSFL